MLDSPEAEVEPGSRVRQAVWLQPVQVTQRTLQTDCRRVPRADRGKTRLRTRKRGDGDLAPAVIEHRPVDGAHIAPQAEQGPMTGRQLGNRKAPSAVAHHQTRP